MYLECISDGKPPPVVTWTKIGGPIGSVPYPAHQRLPIMNANRTAAGTYMCTAVNGIGKAATATRDLDVFCKMFVLLQPDCMMIYSYFEKVCQE